MYEYILIGTPGPTELIIILVLVLILFGAKRIPEIAQGLGKGIREFKKSVKDIQGEIEAPDSSKPKNGKSANDEEEK